MAAPNLSEVELKKITELVFRVNLTRAKGVSFKKIKLATPRHLNNPKFEQMILDTQRFFILHDGTYVLKNKKTLSKLWGSYQYELSHPSTLTKVENLKAQLLEIEEEMDNISKRKLEGEELMKAIMAYGDLQTQVLQIIGRSKEGLESSDHYNEENFVTDQGIYAHPDIIKKIPDKTQRSQAIDTVLNIIYSTGLVFMGRFNNPETGDLYYFYIDMVLVSKPNNWLLNQFKKFIKQNQENQILSQMHNQVEVFLSNQQKAYFNQEFKKQLGEIETLHDEVNAKDFKTRQQVSLSQKIALAKKKFDNLNLDFEKESRKLSGIIEIHTMQSRSKTLVNEMYDQISDIPHDFVFYLNHTLDYTRENVDKEFILLVRNLLEKEPSMESRRELLRKLWQAYREKYSEAMSNLGFKLETRMDATGRGREHILWSNSDYYVCFTRFGKFFIYDKYNVVEIDPSAMFKDEEWKANEELFTRTIRCLKAFLLNQKAFNDTLK